ncbi:MAG: DUF1330 domain-containing protein [SAR324 cluster bacterium]
MRTSYAAALALLAGIGIGAAGIEGLHAQAKPPIYMVADNAVTNPEAYAKEYLPLAQPTIKAHGGRYVAAGKGTSIDGEPPKGRVVILQWDSLEQLKGWRYSPEYMKARTVGEKYAQFRVFAVEGVAQ